MRNGTIQNGIESIAQIAGRELAKISSFDLGFAIGPRLNAAGRIDDMSLGINCLISENIDYTQNTAITLNQLNIERKSIETDIKEEINFHLEEVQPQHKAICLYGEDWHQGVIGIVASRFKDKYHLPTLIFAKNSEDDDGLIKGSGRSIIGFHMRDAIDAISKQYPQIITKFGGHAMAAGLTIKYEYFEQFCHAFYEYAEQNLTPELLQNNIYIDEELKEEEHTFELANLVQQQVWGQGFHSPLFGNYFTVIEQKILKEQHLKLKLALGNSVFEGIYFFNNTEVDSDKIYVAYELSINTFMNKQSLQLMIKYIE
jgi:single-stranded-DNA-specific exonuclease